jgi:hypothetical protein
MAARKTQYEIRRNTAMGWYAAVIALGVLAWKSGAMQLWILPILAWVLYELCYCPTTCGVQTVRGHPCRKAASGRLYACKAEPSHPALKREALRRLLGLQHGAASVPPPARPRAEMPQPAPPEEAPSVEPRQQLMVYLTVVATVAGVIQTIWTVMA